MKQYVTMIKINKYDMYRVLEMGDSRFACIMGLFDPFIRKGKIIEWFNSDNLYFTGSNSIGVDKENNSIVLYNLSSSFIDEDEFEEEEFVHQKIIMSRKNFYEIICKWDELRVSYPDIILVVIHEDNHVSLETDPVIIKEYQDAGYAFDIEKQETA
jgi:hypothetical protein